jgi:hypothetical protein
MKRMMILGVLCFASINLFAQKKVLKDVAETQELSKKVCSLFKENKISAMFAELTPYWPMAQSELDAMEQKTLTQMNIIKERYGNSFESVKVKNETISDFAIRETYLVRYENTAIRLMITYYKNEKGWIINSFKWDDSFALELK